MATLTAMKGHWGCGSVPPGIAWDIGNPAIHLMGFVVQIYSRNFMLPKNISRLLISTVLYNGPLFANWCPVALHLAKFLEAEIMLLSALPLLSIDTPPNVLQRLVAASRHLEAQGQRASWTKHLSWTYGILGKELVDEGRSRLRRFREYVRKPGAWMMPSWKEDLDVQLALSFHVVLKECSVSGNFSVGDIMDADLQLEMASSPSLWEQAMLTVHLSFQELQREVPGKLSHSYLLTGGTLLAMLRHGTGAREVDGVLDFVDKDIDLLVIANTESDWWTTIVALEKHLRNHGWQGCSLAAREAQDRASRWELKQLEMQTGLSLFGRGVLELVCAMFGIDAVTFERAIVPLNVVWLQPFRFQRLVAGKRMYEEVRSRDPEPGDVLMSSSACIPQTLDEFAKPRNCFALPHFPLQSWRGVLPLHFLSPATSCAFLPLTPVMRSIVADHPEEERYSFTVRLPCPRHFVGLLRWYDRGELWGRVEERPCLALPLVVDHDRIDNQQTTELKERGLSHMAIKSIQERMYVMELVGAVNLLEESGNCSWSFDEGYPVSVSTFKGSSTHEADCGLARFERLSCVE